MEESDFGYALRRIKAGDRVQRAGWNGKGMWIKLLEPEGRMGHPCIAMKGVDDKLFAWTPNTLDLMADDWASLER